MVDITNETLREPFTLNFEGTQRGQEPTTLSLPFKLLVLGDFCLRRDEVPQAIRIAQAEFDKIMAQLDPRIVFHLDELPIRDLVQQDQFSERFGQTELVYAFHCLHDFHPNALMRDQPLLADLSSLLNALKKLKHNAKPQQPVDISHLHQGIFDLPELTGDEINLDQLELLIVTLSESINATLNAMLHDARFQALESAWRSVYLLTSTAGENSNVHIDLVNVDRVWLEEDFRSQSELQDTFLFEQLYWREYGQFGGKPYGAVILNMAFDHSGKDIAFLQNLASVAAVAHAPMIAAAAPSLFGVNTYTDLAASSALQDLMNGPQYIKWRSFTASADSTYIALTLPRVQMRTPYRYRQGQVDYPELDEVIDDPQQDIVWGSPAFLFGVCLIRSFVQYGMCSDVCGEPGGLVTLPRCVISKDDSAVSPLEVLLPENRESQIINLGLMPVSSARELNEVAFYSANTLHWASFQYADKERSVVDSLQAQFPYLFVVLRIAHYVKVLFREYLGSLQTVGALQSELNRWLRRYVSDVETPAQAVRARRPLKKADIQITAQSNNPGWFTISMSITPHMKFLGKDFELALNMPVDGELSE